MEPNLRQMYLDIVRKTILGFTYRDPSFDSGRGTQIPFNETARDNGEDWPVLAHSMAGNKRLKNIEDLAQAIFNNNISGDFVETGVWRGGSCIFMSALFEAYGIQDRKIYVCDSFEGLPRPKDNEYPVDKGDTHYTAPFLAVSLEQVQQNFRNYDLLTDKIKFVKGWFSDTLPNFESNQIALLRLDGDMYESTIVALENLYPKLSVGGYVIVDDYGLPNCQRAISDYMEFHNINKQLITIDKSSVYWMKTKEIDPKKAKHRFKNTNVSNDPPAQFVPPPFNKGSSISNVF